MQTRKLKCVFSAGLLALLAVATGARWDTPVRAAAEKQVMASTASLNGTIHWQKLYCRERADRTSVVKSWMRGQRDPCRRCRRAEIPRCR